MLFLRVNIWLDLLDLGFKDQELSETGCHATFVTSKIIWLKILSRLRLTEHYKNLHHIHVHMNTNNHSIFFISKVCTSKLGKCVSRCICWLSSISFLLFGCYLNLRTESGCDWSFCYVKDRTLTCNWTVIFIFITICLHLPSMILSISY